MDQKDLIEEIVARVARKMAQLEEAAPAAEEPAEDHRPGLLILAQDHGDICHSIFESGRLKKQYKIDCALMKHYEVTMDDYQVVVMFGLTNEAMTKLASGITDTPYTRLAAQAILTGKRIYVPVEQIELFRYAETAPKPYYAMLQRKLALLTDSGLVISRMEDLECCILDEQGACCKESVKFQAEQVCQPQKEYRLCKRVITERDISEACGANATCIRIPAKSIVTDLAREFAHTRDISLIRE